MFHWDPAIHGLAAGREWNDKLRRWSPRTSSCITRSRAEHQNLVREFESLLAGTETTLAGTGMLFRRLNDADLFLLMKQSLNPLISDTVPRRSYPLGRYESVRSQISNVSIEAEPDDYLKAG